MIDGGMPPQWYISLRVWFVLLASKAMLLNSGVLLDDAFIVEYFGYSLHHVCMYLFVFYVHGL